MPLKFINLWQTKEERTGKYWLVRSLGATAETAKRLRDWRLSKIERLFNLGESNYRNREEHDAILESLSVTLRENG